MVLGLGIHALGLRFCFVRSAFEVSFGGIGLLLPVSTTQNKVSGSVASVLILTVRAGYA